MERGVKVKTSNGEVGIVIGGKKNKVRIWVESSQKSKYVRSDEVTRAEIRIRR